ncbi:MAG: polysaccharide deacetylase family protein [Actinomycetota bacterium]|nr:polysaccharide deacetylase family protein [Actinomycetota bacterium]
MGTLVRAAAVVLTTLATAYILQAQDWAATTTTPPVRLLGDFEDAAPADIQQSFLSPLEVVPLGRHNIAMPILTYHYVRQPPPMQTDLVGYRLSVSPADFAAQMDWLAAHGFHPVDYNDVRAYFAGTRPLPARPVVITLDDGYTDLYTTAYPILRAHAFKAVAYIVSGFVGQPRYVTAGQVVEMDRHGIQIASHTVDHANIGGSTSFYSALRQLSDSKRWLETLVDHPVLDFAYPSGKFTAQAIAAVKQAGYDTAVTEMSSVDHSLSDRYVWTRIWVRGGEPLAEFANSLGTPMPHTLVAALDFETVGIELPPLKRPTSLQHK